MAKQEVLTFDQMPSKGLRPNNRMPRNSQYFTTLQNIRVRPEGLVAYDAVTQPVSTADLTSASVTIAFPFPQLFRGKWVTLLADETKLFTVNESTWAITQVTTYDLYTPASTKAITAGGPWHFMDFFNTWMLFNGECCILKFGGDAKYYVQDTLSVQTGCAHRGRAIQGGFSTSDFWSSTWKTFWTSRIIQDNPPNSSIVKTMTDIGPNWVMWSTIGGGDLRFIHDVTWATTGPYTVGHDSAHPYILDYIRRNEWGLMPMTFQGSVLNTTSLGQHVFVGGEDGINILTQYSSPVPTFGLSLSLPYGILSRSAVGGNDERIVFLDEDGCLWHLDAALKLDRLDYTEYFNPMVGTDVVINYHPQEQDFYISNGADCFILSRDGGLSQGPQLLTSLAWAQGGPIGFFESEADSTMLAVSDVFDMGYGGLKQIQQTLITGDPDETLQVAYDYRYDRNGSWTRTPFTTVGKESNVFTLIAGNEFRLVIKKPSSYTGVKIERIDITWKPIDKRFSH